MWQMTVAYVRETHIVNFDFERGRGASGPTAPSCQADFGDPGL
jgi:hypothetical protein